MSLDTLSRLLGSKVDRRAENVRYRQDQLQKLHTGLIENGIGIREALEKDTGYTMAEAEVEFAMGIKAVRDHYNGLDFQRSLDQEYRIAKNLDAVEHKVSVGLVFIASSKTFPFFSLLAPLAAAVAAGNSILIKLEHDLRHLSPLLRATLSVLDPDTLALTAQDVTDQDFLAQAILVDQEQYTTSSKHQARRNALQSPQSQRVIAVVDRTADLELAASALVRARFGFRGQSTYAPDLVLVNEFVAESFLKAVARNTVAYSDDAEGGGGAVFNSGSYKHLLKEVELDPTTSISTQVRGGSVVQISSRFSPLLLAQVNGAVLLITTISSLDDAITLANSLRSQNVVPVDEACFIASYIFATPPAAKYLSQFLDAQASFVNNIPSELLVGPAAPINSQHGISISHRYEPSMFQISRPQFVHEPASSILQSAILRNGAGTGNPNPTPSHSERLRQLLLDEAAQPLNPTGQVMQIRGIGFFEQGIVTGLTLAAMPVFLVLGFGGYYGGRYVWRHLLKHKWSSL